MSWKEPIKLSRSAVVVAGLAINLTATALGDFSLPLVDDADLHDVHFVDTQVGWAVGDRGAIWSTRSGGNHWEARRCPDSWRLASIDFVDQQHGWIVGGAIRPYQHDGQGHVLTTEDGGQTWQAKPRTNLSYARGLAFSDERTGFVLTSPQPLFPSGLFQTRDAGHGWHPLPHQPQDEWVAVDVGPDGKLLLVERHAARAAVTPSQPDSGVGTARIASRLCDGCYLQPRHAIVVGDQGRLLAWLDGRWLDARQSLPENVNDQIDFRTVAAVGNSVWIAGAPGSVVLHSPNGGGSWKAYPTGQTLPIHKLAFVDRQHGWAVGALGLIMATDDGGVSWHVQRGQERRLGALLICDRTSSLPLTLMAYLSTEQSLRSRAIVLDAAANDPTWALNPADRLHAAAIAVGANGAEVWHEFPLAPEIVAANENAIAVGWIRSQASGGSNVPAARLRRRLEIAIRQWRPSVVVVGRNHDDQIVGQLLLREAQAALDPGEAAGRALAAIGLPSWQPSNLVATQPATTPPAERMTTVRPNQLALGLGQSLGELAAGGHTLLSSQPPEARTISYRCEVGPPLSKQWTQVAQRQGAGAVHNHQRALSAATSNVDALARRVQQQENLRALLGRATTVDAAGRALQLIDQLPGPTAARLLLLLADQYAAANDYPGQVQTWESIRQQFAQDPAAHESLWRQFASASSEEVQVRFRNGGARSIQPTAPDQSASVPVVGSQPALPSSHVVPVAGVSRPDSLSSARDLFALADRNLRISPEWQLAMAAVERSMGNASTAQGMLKRQKRSGPSPAWRRAAAMEIWFTEPDRPAPKPTWTCHAGQRPHLDGQLDESIWQTAQRRPLGALRPLDQPLPTEIFLAHDEEFLFLAVRCSKIGGLEYPPTLSPRPRDTPPGKLDRVDFLFDVNRDYHSGWRLGFDCSGNAIDSETGDLNWNPQWYVAAAQDDAHWTAEAAVPLRELTRNSSKLDAWVFGVRRIVPGWGWQTWPSEATAQPAWHQLGYLVFGNGTVVNDPGRKSQIVP